MSSHCSPINDNPSPPAWYDAALDECYFCSEEAANECCDCSKSVCLKDSVTAWDKDQSLGAELRCNECCEKHPMPTVLDLAQRATNSEKRSDREVAACKLAEIAASLHRALKDVLDHVEDDSVDRMPAWCCTLCFSYRKMARTALAKVTAGKAA